MSSKPFATLEQVDPIDREILELRHRHETSNKDTATALGLSRPAAGMRYLRAPSAARSAADEPVDGG
jgi:DNA-directed RNA polymerase specialized sigma24 family protein